MQKAFAKKTPLARQMGKSVVLVYNHVGLQRGLLDWEISIGFELLMEGGDGRTTLKPRFFREDQKNRGIAVAQLTS